MLEWILSLDRTLFTLINSKWTNPFLDSFFPFITDLHKNSYFVIFALPTLLVYFIASKGIKKGLIIYFFTFLTLAFSDGTGNYVFKRNFQRPRPAADLNIQAITRSPSAGFSFISNHAVNNFAFATFLSFFFPLTNVLFFSMAFLVCYSRIYNGAHYPTDVFVGAIVGILCGLIIALICKKTLQVFKQKKVTG